jgi:hypothetical protein
VAQVVECLPSKHGALSSNASAAEIIKTAPISPQRSNQMESGCDVSMFHNKIQPFGAGMVTPAPIPATWGTKGMRIKVGDWPGQKKKKSTRPSLNHKSKRTGDTAQVVECAFT